MAGGVQALKGGRVVVRVGGKNHPLQALGDHRFGKKIANCTVGNKNFALHVVVIKEPRRDVYIPSLEIKSGDTLIGHVFNQAGILVARLTGLGKDGLEEAHLIPAANASLQKHGTTVKGLLLNKAA